MFLSKLFNKQKTTPVEKNSSEIKENYSVYYKNNPLWTSSINHKKLEETYRNNSTIFRCVHLISECANSMKITTTVAGLQTYLNKNLEDIITHLLVYGNCFLHRDLFLLPINKLSILTTSTNVVIGYKNNEISYDEQEILHLKYCSNPGNNIHSISPIQICVKWVDICNFIQEYVGGMMQNGGKPSGILSHGPIINEKERNSFKEQFKELYKNMTHNGQVVVAEGRFEWKALGIEPEKLHLLDHWTNSVKEIANCFGVPSILLGVTGDATFSNYSHARKHLWEDLIIPFVLNLIEKLQDFFDCEIKVNTQNIEIMNEKIWQKNILTINEKRKLLGYEPIVGGDIL